MIKKEDVNHVAKLARLGIGEKESLLFQKHLSSILDYFNSLKSAKTEKVDPTFHSTEKFLDPKIIMRDDIAKPSPCSVPEQMLEAAPDKKDRHVKVKVILQ